MADKRGLQHPQGLACPLCLDTFKNPTLLLCGHTFCKVCLEGYDQQRNGVDHMECPVCRKRTKLKENRIAGLSPNFSLKGLQDELHIDEQTSQNLCPLHKAEDRNIFCEACEIFICIVCFIKNHQGHRIIRKTDLKEGLRKKRMALIQDGKAKKSQIEELLKDAEQQKNGICCHLSKMEREIRDAYAKKFTTLQENERKLIEKVHSIQRGSDKQLNCCIAQHIESIDNISILVVILESNDSEHLQDHVLIEDHLRCISLENSLKKVNKTNDDQSMAQVQVAKNSKFHCAKSELLDVGHIELGNAEAVSIQGVKTTAPVAVHTLGQKGKKGKATTSNSQQAKTTAPVAVHTLGHNGRGGKATTSNSQHGMTTAQVNMNTDEMQPSTSGNVGAITAIPAMVKNNSLTIVSVKETKCASIFGMAALSPDSVVIGFGSPGSVCFSLSGEITPYLGEEEVCDIACLTHGRSAVSGFDGVSSLCFIYNARGKTKFQYQCKQGCRYRSYLKLCSDQHDNVYAVNGNPEIYIFSGCNPNPQTIIPTGKVEPSRICATQTGAIIISGRHGSVTVYDREGCVGSSIKPDKVMIDYLYAAVDSRDRVLVARVENFCDVLRLSRYTLQGVTLTEEVMFQELKLPHDFKPDVCYMVSLSPSMIALSTGKHLYFIEHAL